MYTNYHNSNSDKILSFIYRLLQPFKGSIFLSDTYSMLLLLWDITFCPFSMWNLNQIWHPMWWFQNTPCMLNLMKFCLRYLRLKAIDIFQKLILFHLFHCQLSPIFLHQIQRSGTDFFSARHEDSKTVIDYWNW